jgi:hypothetical protein
MPWAAVVLTLAAAAVAAWSAAHYASDFRDFMSGGARFIAGTNLYEGSGAFNGFIGPPFQALFHAPVAAIFRISPAIALALWTAITFVALVVGVRVWAGTLSVPASSPAVLTAVLVVAFPVYREFQGQNMTALLFLFGGLSARALVRARDSEAGAWVALGAALKFYPGMPFAYFAARGRWRMIVAGGATLLGLSLLPAIRFGAGRFVWLCQEWIRTRKTSIWPADYQSQSLPHVVRLLWPGDARAQAATGMFLILVAATMLLAWSRRRMPLAAGEEMAFATLIGFVASPIGWICYWILAIPALIVVSRDAGWHKPSQLALIISAFFGLVVGPITRDHPRGEYLAIAVVLLAMLAYRLRPGAASSVAS